MNLSCDGEARAPFSLSGQNVFTELSWTSANEDQLQLHKQNWVKMAWSCYQVLCVHRSQPQPVFQTEDDEQEDDDDVPAWKRQKVTWKFPSTNSEAARSHSEQTSENVRVFVPKTPPFPLKHNGRPRCYALTSTTDIRDFFFRPYEAKSRTQCESCMCRRCGRFTRCSCQDITWSRNLRTALHSTMDSSEHITLTCVYISRPINSQQGQLMCIGRLSVRAAMLRPRGTHTCDADRGDMFRCQRGGEKDLRRENGQAFQQKHSSVHSSLYYRLNHYKTYSGNSKVTSLPVSFLYTAENVSICKEQIYIRINFILWTKDIPFLCCWRVMTKSVDGGKVLRQLTLCSTFVCWFLSRWTLINRDPSSLTRILFPTISAG